MQGEVSILVLEISKIALQVHSKYTVLPTPVISTTNGKFFVFSRINKYRIQRNSCVLFITTKKQSVYKTKKVKKGLACNGINMLYI
jgi:hypothetical protein